jgi:short-subunit dehydrogenase
MYEKHSGHIVNVASGAGVIATPEPLPYIASKFAVVGISEALYGRLKNQGINVSVVIPSYIRTNIFSNAKIKYPQKLLEDVGREKLDHISKEILDEMASKAMLPSRAVKRYIKGIKKNQLYVYDIKGVIGAMSLKGSNPQQYENMLVNFFESTMKTRRENFLKHGINIDKYT